MSVSDIQMRQRSFFWEDQWGHQKGGRVCVYVLECVCVVLSVLCFNFGVWRISKIGRRSSKRRTLELQTAGAPWVEACMHRLPLENRRDQFDWWIDRMATEVSSKWNGKGGRGHAAKTQSTGRRVMLHDKRHWTCWVSEFALIFGARCPICQVPLLFSLAGSTCQWVIRIWL